jgi:hypothetical protein
MHRNAFVRKPIAPPAATIFHPFLTGLSSFYTLGSAASTTL